MKPAILRSVRTTPSVLSALGAGAALGVVLTLAAVGLAAQGDRAVAQAVMAELGREPNRREVVADAIAHAQDALERGARMRAAGDELHASEADALARQWAETGREILRAVQTEAKATELRKRALETEAEVAKTREIVEEVIARTGRLRAQIESAERDGGAARVAVEVHDGDRPSSKRQANTKGAAQPAVDGGAP
jgi:hypothetical protein